MIKEWRETMIDNGHQPGTALVETDLTFPLTDKIGICIVGGLLGLMVASIYGPMADAVAIGVYLLGVLLLVAINLKHQLLPDQIVLTLLWLGLLRVVGTDHLADHVLGAAVGYAGPLFALHLLKLATRSQLLGFGDYKALAIAGAWFGVAKLPLLFIAFIGAVILMMAVEAMLKRRGMMGTGSAHLAASLACVLVDSPSLDWIRQ